MKRRKFLKGSLLSSLPLVLDGISFSLPQKKSLLRYLANEESERVLVIIQLNGGNDGLNTIIPFDGYSNLQNLRSNIILPNTKIIPLNTNLGVHPEMEMIKELFKQDRLSIIQGVGYPNHNRSHFRSADILETGSSSDEYWTTGWIGRYIDSDSFVSDEGTSIPYPYAISLGSSISSTCEGESINHSLALIDPSLFFNLGNPCYSTNSDIGVPTINQELKNFIQVSKNDANKYASSINTAYDNSSNSGSYPENNPLADQLKLTAKLLEGGLKTKIFVANLNGFDTHADQVDSSDTTKGPHANLLKQLSEAIFAFQEDLTQLGISEKVLGFCYSEFGRQIESNDSMGTDHGTAGPMFLFGDCVKGEVVGLNPEIPSQVAPQEAVPMQHDYRSVYGSILNQWFNVEVSVVENILGGTFPFLPLIECPSPLSTSTNTISQELELSLFPNPSKDFIYLEMPVELKDANITLFNLLGKQLISQPLNGKDASLNIQNLSAGNYFIRVQNEEYQFTKNFTKL